LKALTKAQRTALEWIQAREPIGQFPLSGGPKLGFVRKLKDAGLIEERGKEPGRLFAFVRYGLSQAGRDALAGRS
jgi:hypothetical protein